ncbi:MAG TPA: DUF2075 domain-containing protein [Chromatiales bacterium]|nr:DUF2075 domain-containing protein [Chromatiales bacterium]
MYESFYKLSGKPFSLTPDPRFFFGSRGHKRALSYLRYGLKQGEGFIVVTGDIGAGKTTLAALLCEELADQGVIAGRVESTQLGPTEFLAMLSATLGLRHEAGNKVALLKNLETYLKARARQGKRVVIVVDEAQNLPVETLEELRMLCNFQVDERPVLQAFLLGQEQFREVLADTALEQFRQRVIASCHLGPMDLDETRAYIEHRLKLVGWKDDPKLSPELYAEVHQYTGGIPRRINTVVDRLLLFGYLEERHELGVDAFETVRQELLEEGFGEDAIARRRAEKAKRAEAAEADGAEGLELRIVDEPLEAAAPAAQGAAQAAPRIVAVEPEGSLAARVAALERRVEELEAMINGAREALLEALVLGKREARRKRS